MPRFRKRPLEIEAWEFDGTAECAEEISWMDRAISFSVCPEPVGVVIEIATLEGTMEAHKGDWIIRGIKGEFYPCRGDIFAETYETADVPAPQDHTFPYDRV